MPETTKAQKMWDMTWVQKADMAVTEYKIKIGESLTLKGLQYCADVQYDQWQIWFFEDLDANEFF